MKFAAVALLAALAAACAPDPSSADLHATALVATAQAPGTVFSSYATFAIVDQVPLTDNTGAGDPVTEFLPPAQSAQLISAVTNEMEARGYTLVDKSLNPDLGVSISASKSSVVYGYYYPGYWYGGWYGWGWYYPMYPTYSYSTYDVGTLFISAADFKNASRPPIGSTEPGSLTVIWATAIYGVLSSTTSYNVNRALEGISRSFDQSPYILR